MLLIKIGGGKNINWDGICADILSLMNKEQIICVHGANAKRDEIAAKMSVPVKIVISPSGISSVYTDEEALEVFIMAYAGLVNKQIVGRMLSHGLNAVGLSGIDGKLWVAKRKKHLLIKEGKKIKLLKDNKTGRVEVINTHLIHLLLNNNYLPVICPPAISYENEIVNTDNDWAIAVMAEALNIKKIVSLFEAPGLLKDAEDESSLIRHIEKRKIEDYLQYGKERMKKKILGAKKAIEAGVEIIFWGDGRIEHPVQSALEGKGTVIS